MLNDSFQFPESDDSMDDDDQELPPEDEDDDDSVNMVSDDDDDYPRDNQSFVTPRGEAPTVSMPQVTDIPPAVAPDDTKEKEDKAHLRRVRIWVLVGVVAVLILGFIACYKYFSRPASVATPSNTQQSQVQQPAPTQTPQVQQPAPTQEPQPTQSPAQSQSNSSMQLESSAPNVKNVFQATGFIKEKNIYKYGNQRLYELSFQVSNVNTPLSVFVPADTYAKAQDGDKYQIVYGEYVDGVFGIRALSKVVEN